VISSSSNQVEIDFSSVSYASLRPYLQLDTRSDSGIKISEGGLAENIVLDMDIQPQDNILSTNITNFPSLFSLPSRYLKYQNSLRPRSPPIVEDKVIETNNNNQATFFSDKLIMDFHRAHFAPITPTPQQHYPSTPEPDYFQSIKDGDERPIRKPRK
ncbi:23091_t:CDS:2, partial [Rhizophagus irregularis]